MGSPATVSLQTEKGQNLWMVVQGRVNKFAFAVIGAGLFVLLELIASPGGADAHARPNKSTVPAGSRQEVRFTIEHGCNGSPTIKLQVKLPDSVVKPEAAARTGWVSDFDASANTITWSGGSLSAKTKGDFGVTVTFPKTKGAVLLFPMVQTCKKGSLRWIEGPKSSYPAPSVTLT